jgi:hypothetical protein
MSAEVFIIYPAGEGIENTVFNKVLADTPDPYCIFEARTEHYKDVGTGKVLPILMDLPNWKTFVGVELTTVPKLIGAGSYVESKHIAEREFSFTVSVKGEDILDTEEITDTLMAQMYNFAPVKFFRLFLDRNKENPNGNPIKKMEVLEGYLTGFSDWTQMNGYAKATFSARCPNPEKTTYTYNETFEIIGTKIGL